MSKIPERRHQPGERLALKPRGGEQVAAYTRLPERRHSDDEVQQIRRREAMRVRPPLAQIRVQAAALPVVVFGYLLAAAGGLALWLVKEEWEHGWTAKWCGVGAGVVAMLLAFSIALRKPRSRHHAALIAIAGLLVVVFGVLQLLPQSHAT